MNEKANNVVKQLVSKLDNELSSMGVSIESLNHMRNVLGRMALEANDKYSGERQKFFLWDYNDILQTIDALMFHQMNIINENFKQLDDMKEELCSLMWNWELEDKKAPRHGNDEKGARK